jgi:hypothetical protein
MSDAAEAAETDWLDDEESLLLVDFTNSFERLPASAPKNHAHIIDLDSYTPFDVDDEYDLKIWDAVATMLFTISEETLCAFLDSDNKTFQLLQGPEQKCQHSYIFVERRKSEVLVCHHSKLCCCLLLLTATLTQVGQYHPHPQDNIIEFDNLVRCTVNLNGSWKIKDASFGNLMRNNINDAWNGDFLQYPNRGTKAQDEKTKSEFARILSMGILTQELDEYDCDCKPVIKKT